MADADALGLGPSESQSSEYRQAVLALTRMTEVANHGSPTIRKFLTRSGINPETVDLRLGGGLAEDARRLLSSVDGTGDFPTLQEIERVTAALEDAIVDLETVIMLEMTQRRIASSPQISDGSLATPALIRVEPVTLGVTHGTIAAGIDHPGDDSIGGSAHPAQVEARPSVDATPVPDVNTAARMLRLEQEVGSTSEKLGIMFDMLTQLLATNGNGSHIVPVSAMAPRVSTLSVGGHRRSE